MAQKHDLNWDDDTPARRRAIAPWVARAGGYGIGLLIVAIVAYYLIGMALTHRISDDVDLAVSDTPPGASRSVQMAADLIYRETEQNSWVANNPFFLPGYMLDNMPNFQQGVINAISRFAIEMSDQLGQAEIPGHDLAVRLRNLLGSDHPGGKAICCRPPRIAGL